MIHGFYYETPIGRVGIAEENGALTNVFFGNTVRPDVFDMEESPLLKRAAAQISQYLAGRRRDFDLPLSPQGTLFQLAVWTALQTIPYGQTRSYAQIAAQIDKPAASRAVGRANALNPLSLLVPCHRVIGAAGDLVGYAGGLALKRRLLALEREGGPIAAQGVTEAG